MNIIWKQPNGNLAITFMNPAAIAEMQAAQDALQNPPENEDELLVSEAFCIDVASRIGITLQAHALLLLQQGNVPSDWVAVGFDVADLPTEPQSTWRWVDGAISVDATALLEFRRSEIKTQIAAMEAAQQMPRATREFMLLFMESQATPEQLALQPGYVAVKEFDNSIKLLRESI